MEFRSDEEELSEKEAQLQYENSKLQDELNHLKDHTLSVEENLNTVCFTLSQKENIIKSLEQQISLLCQAMKEKEQLVELLECEKGCVNQWKEKLLSANLALKEELKKERLINDQIETLKSNEEKLRNLIVKLKEENSQLAFELHVKSEELSLATTSLKNLEVQIKELEDEKAELIALRDMLLSQDKEKHLNSPEAKMCFLKKNSEWSKFGRNFLTHDDQESTSVPCNKVSTNLREEILEVEVAEKQNRITELEKLLHEKETLEAERNNLIGKLKVKLYNVKLLKCDLNTNFKIDSSAMYDIYEDLDKILNWPEGQPNECKPLTEMASLAVVVKNGVQTTQPGSIRIVETVSIASQTDPIKNLSPVLFPGTIEILESDQNDLRFDDPEQEPLRFPEDNNGRKVVQLFSEHRNCDLDMDIYRMSKKSDTSFSGIEELEESCLMDSLEGSFISSNNSRDVNLNSKKFTDCNLLESLPEQKSVSKFSKNSKKENTEAEETGNDEATRKTDKCETNQKNNLHNENCPKDARESSNPVVNCSTPISDSAGSQALATLFTVSPDASSTDNGTQTFVLATNVSNERSALTNEEIGKKFQDLSFAFKTDSLTIRNRLHLMKRRRDQAEFIIEKELKTIKAKLKNLQGMCLNSEYINLMSDLKKQLDFVLNASIQLSSSAESYGYAQHEESSLDFVSVMLQHVENVETINSETSKVLEKLKHNSNKFPAVQPQDVDTDCDNMLRRQSMPVSPRGFSCRRRASIATLPGISSSVLEDRNDGMWTPKRHVTAMVKKLSFSQSTSSKSIPGSVAEEGRRDSNFGRQKLENRESESSLKGINEFRDELTSGPNPEPLEEDVDDGPHNEESNDSSLHLKQFFDSIEDIRHNSNSQDLIHYLKKIVELNKLVLSATRFRWPENVLQHVPFYITWYVVFILALVFIGGLFTGINGCYIYSCLKLSYLWVAALACLTLTRRISRLALLLILTVVFLTVALLFWLTRIVLPRMSDSEVDAVLKTLGLEIRYPYGPPPV